MRLKKFPTSFYISISIGFAQISGEDVIAKMMKNPSPSDIKMNFKMTLSSNSKEKKSKKHFRLMEQIEKRYQDGEFKSKLLFLSFKLPSKNLNVFLIFLYDSACCSKIE